MKNTFKVLLVFVAIFMTVGCGKDLSEYAGTYEGKYTKFVGDPDDVIDEEEFTLVLNKNGKGTHYRNTLEIKITWDVKGEEFTMHEKMGALAIDYNETLKDGKLVIYNGDKNDDLTAQYVYEKKED